MFQSQVSLKQVSVSLAQKAALCAAAPAPDCFLTTWLSRKHPIDFNAYTVVPGLSIPSLEGVMSSMDLVDIVNGLPGLSVTDPEGAILNKSLMDVIHKTRVYTSDALQAEMLGLMSNMANLIVNFHLLDHQQDAVVTIFRGFAALAASDCGQNINSQLSETFHRLLFLAIQVAATQDCETDEAPVDSSELFRVIIATSVQKCLKAEMTEMAGSMLPEFPDIDVHYRSYVLNIGAEAFGLKTALGAQEVSSDANINSRYEIQNRAYTNALLENVTGEKLLEAICQTVNDIPDVRTKLLAVLHEELAVLIDTNPEFAKQVGIELDDENEMVDFAQGPQKFFRDQGLYEEGYVLVNGVAQEKQKLTPKGVFLVFLHLGLIQPRTPIVVGNSATDKVVELQIALLRQDRAKLLALAQQLPARQAQFYLRTERLFCNGDGQAKRYFCLLLLYKSGQREALRVLFERMTTSRTNSADIYRWVESHPIHLHSLGKPSGFNFHPHEENLFINPQNPQDRENVLTIMADVGASNTLELYFKQAFEILASQDASAGAADITLEAIQTSLIAVLERLSVRSHFSTAFSLLEKYLSFIPHDTPQVSAFLKTLTDRACDHSLAEHGHHLIILANQVANEALKKQLLNTLYLMCIREDSPEFLEIFIAEKALPDRNPLQTAYESNAKKCFRLLTQRLEVAHVAKVLTPLHDQALKNDDADWIVVFRLEVRDRYTPPFSGIDLAYRQNAFKCLDALVLKMPIARVQARFTEALQQGNFDLCARILKSFVARDKRAAMAWLNTHDPILQTTPLQHLLSLTAAIPKIKFPDAYLAFLKGALLALEDPFESMAQIIDAAYAASPPNTALLELLTPDYLSDFPHSATLAFQVLVKSYSKSTEPLRAAVWVHYSIEKKREKSHKHHGFFEAFKGLLIQETDIVLKQKMLMTCLQIVFDHFDKSKLAEYVSVLVQCVCPADGLGLLEVTDTDVVVQAPHKETVHHMMGEVLRFLHSHNSRAGFQAAYKEFCRFDQERVPFDKQELVRLYKLFLNAVPPAEEPDVDQAEHAEAEMPRTFSTIGRHKGNQLKLSTSSTTAGTSHSVSRSSSSAYQQNPLEEDD